MKKPLIPKISVTIITYNQENLISRALESILIQEEWVYEIIVCDDCSKDNTWNVVLDYAKEYPALIKPYRNNINLGIFGNIESTWNKTSGDAVILMAGDDELCNGLFEKAIYLIDKNKIDYKNESFCLYFDYEVVYPTKRLNFISKLFDQKPSNKLIVKGFDPISLKIRVLAVNRTVIYSNKIQQKFIPVSEDIGIFADGILDIQVQQFSEKSYYYPFVGSKYYAKIGVSVTTDQKESIRSKIKLMEAYEDMFNLSFKDACWTKYIKTKNQFLLTPKFKLLLLSLKYYIQSIEFKYGIRGLRLKMLPIDILTFWNLHFKK